MPAFNDIKTYNAFHSSGVAGGTIKSGPGILHTVLVNTPVAGGTVTLQDGGVTIALITVPATAGNPFELTYDVQFFSNLSISVTGAGMDVTVSWM